MAKKAVTIRTDDGKTTTVRVDNDEAAREYEDLPFTSPNVTSVSVTDAD